MNAAELAVISDLRDAFVLQLRETPWWRLRERAALRATVRMLSLFLRAAEVVLR